MEDQAPYHVAANNNKQSANKCINRPRVGGAVVFSIEKCLQIVFVTPTLGVVSNELMKQQQIKNL